MVWCALLALLAGCGSGGGPSQSLTVAGRVMAPDGNVGAVSRQATLAGVPSQQVTLGTVDDSGLNFQALPDATTLTDNDGRYSLALPAGTAYGPRLTVIAGEAAYPVLSNFVLGATADLGPAETAAHREALDRARGAGVGLSTLSSGLLGSYLRAAATATGALPVSATLPEHTAAAAQALRANAGATAALAAVVPQAPFRVDAIAPRKGTVGTNVNVAITGSGLTGASVETDGTRGVTVGNISVVNDTRITATVYMTNTAGVGEHPIRVTKVEGAGPGATVLRRSTTFWVEPVLGRPRIDSIDPANVTISDTLPTSFGVRLTGTNFTPASAISVSPSRPARLSSTTYVSTTILDTYVTIDPTQTNGGVFTFTVTNGTGGLASNSFGLTVSKGATAALQLNGISPATVRVPLNGGPRSFRIAFAGRGFVNPVPLPVGVAGIRWSAARRVTANSFEATITIDPAAYQNSVRLDLFVSVQSGSTHHNFSNIQHLNVWFE
jgi:hypothetical protein